MIEELKGDWFEDNVADFKAQKRHPGTVDLLRFFAYSHLPQNLQDISVQLAATAITLVRQIPDSAELTAGLRKLLEAKDCFVRASLEPKL